MSQVERGRGGRGGGGGSMGGLTLLFCSFEEKKNISTFPWTLFSIDVVGFCSLCVVCYAQIASRRFRASSARTVRAAL